MYHTNSLRGNFRKAKFRTRTFQECVEQAIFLYHLVVSISYGSFLRRSFNKIQDLLQNPITIYFKHVVLRHNLRYITVKVAEAGYLTNDCKCRTDTCLPKCCLRSFTYPFQTEVRPNECYLTHLKTIDKDKLFPGRPPACTTIIISLNQKLLNRKATSICTIIII